MGNQLINPLKDLRWTTYKDAETFLLFINLPRLD